MDQQGFIDLVQRCINSPTPEDIDQYNNYRNTEPKFFLTNLLDSIIQQGGNEVFVAQLNIIMYKHLIARTPISGIESLSEEQRQHYLMGLLGRVAAQCTVDKARLYVKSICEFVIIMIKCNSDISIFRQFIDQGLEGDTTTQKIIAMFIVVLTQDSYNICHKYGIQLIFSYVERLSINQATHGACLEIIKNMLVNLNYVEQSEISEEAQCQLVLSMFHILAQNQTDYKMLIFGAKMFEDLFNCVARFLQANVAQLLEFLKYVIVVHNQYILQNQLYYFNEEYFKVLNLLVTIGDPPEELYLTTEQRKFYNQMLMEFVICQFDRFNNSESIELLQQQESYKVHQTYCKDFFDIIQEFVQVLSNDNEIQQQLFIGMGQCGASMFAQLCYYNCCMRCYQISMTFVGQISQFISKLDIKSLNIMEQLIVLDTVLHILQLNNSPNNRPETEFIASFNQYVVRSILQRLHGSRTQVIVQYCLEILILVGQTDTHDFEQASKDYLVMEDGGNVHTQTIRLRMISEFVHHINNDYLQKVFTMCMDDVQGLRIGGQKQEYMAYISQQIQLIQKLFSMTASSTLDTRYLLLFYNTVMSILQDENIDLYPDLQKAAVEVLCQGPIVSTQSVTEQYFLYLMNLYTYVLDQKHLTDMGQKSILEGTITKFNNNVMIEQNFVYQGLSILLLNYTAHSQTEFDAVIKIYDLILGKQQIQSCQFKDQALVHATIFYFFYKNNQAELGRRYLASSAEIFKCALGCSILGMAQIAKLNIALKQLITAYNELRLQECRQEIIEVLVGYTIKIGDQIQKEYLNMFKYDINELEYAHGMKHHHNGAIKLLLLFVSNLDDKTSIMERLFADPQFNTLFMQLQMFNIIYSQVDSAADMNIDIIQTLVSKILTLFNEFQTEIQLEQNMYFDDTIHSFFTTVIFNCCRKVDPGLWGQIAQLYTLCDSNFDPDRHPAQFYLYYNNIIAMVRLVCGETFDLQQMRLSQNNNFEPLILFAHQNQEILDRQLVRSTISQVYSQVGVSEQLFGLVQDILSQPQEAV